MKGALGALAAEKAGVKYIYGNNDLFFPLERQTISWNKSQFDMAIPRRMLFSLIDGKGQ